MIKRKSIIAVIAIALFSATLTGCREESKGEKVKDAVEDVADDIEDAVD